MIAVAPDLAHTDVRALALELFAQSERFTAAGLTAQAEVLLDQVWSIAVSRDRALADSAAWRLGWLLVGRRDYGAARRWFERVSQQPCDSEQTWGQVRAALVQLCSQAASPRVAPPPAAESPGAAPASRLECYSLGRLVIVRDGVELPPCPARRALGVLRYLLTRPRFTAKREELMEALWPEVEPQRAAHSLHVAVSTLRRYLDQNGGQTSVLFESGQYMLSPELAVESDALSFSQWAAEGESAWRAGNYELAEQCYQRAVSYYAGDFFVDDADTLWALAERERLLSRFLLALERLGGIYARRGAYELAAEHFRRLLDHDSYREDICQQLMICYLQLGRRDAALREYERCSAALSHDLGITPMPALQELVAAARQ